MADSTNISWADSTFNPWIGCEKVSPGCAHCYAEQLVTGRMGRANTWGPDGIRQRTSEALWRRPLAWNREAEAAGVRRRVFCASLADVFEPRPELEPWRRDLFELIAETPALDWLVLTKRPDLARDWLRAWYEEPVSYDRYRLEGDENWHWRTDADGVRIGFGVLPNLWIGTSIENAAYTWRADVLREIPAPVRFISAEPLLGTLFPKTASSKDVHQVDEPDGDAQRVTGEAEPNAATGALPPQGGTSVPEASADESAGPAAFQRREPRQSPTGSPRPRSALDLSGIDWIIVGGESGGRSSRPIHPAWVREIRDAVLALDEPEPLRSSDADGRVVWEGFPPQRPALHFKQWGSWAPDPNGICERAVYLAHDGRAYGRMALDAIDLDHHPLADPVFRMGYRGSSPSAGGKLLDGIDWCEIPDPGLALTPA